MKVFSNMYSVFVSLIFGSGRSYIKPWMGFLEGSQGFQKFFFSELCLGIVDILLVDMQLFIQIYVRSLYAMVRLEW